MKEKNIFAFILSALFFTGSAVMAAYPQPVLNEDGTYTYNVGQSDSQLNNNTDGYPSNLQGVGSDTGYVDKWLGGNAGGTVTEYSNPDKRFTIEGKHFILLDKDDDGNFFVIADEMYGKRNLTSVTRNTNQDASNAWDQMFYEGTWKYDPENKNSIAYWLNNSFLESGNDGNLLPEAIIDNLVEKEWGVEGGTKIEDQFFYKYCDTENNPPQPKYTSVAPYVVTQKVSLLSASEYWAYYEDISPLTYGAAPFASGNPWDYQAWYLRTPMNQPMTILTGAQGIYIDGNRGRRGGVNIYNPVGIRPCFWLESDFFSEVMLDFDNDNILAGDLVKETIRDSYAKAEMAELYDAQTLREQFGYPEFGPLAAQNPDIIGNSAVGSVQTAKYSFTHENSSFTEGDTKYQWYVSEEDGSFVKIDGATNKIYTPPAEFEGKRLKVSIRCTDNVGSVAPQSFSPETLPLRAKQNITAEFEEITNADGSSFTGNGVKASFSVESGTSESMCIFVGIYDANNKLITLKIEDVVINAGNNIVSASIDTFNGKSVKAVLVDSKISLRPLAVGEISR